MINYYPWAVYCESPPSFIWGEEGAKTEGLLYLQSTIDIHILNMFRLTVGIHFQNTLLLPLSLLLCSLLLPNCKGSHSVRLLRTFASATHNKLMQKAQQRRYKTVAAIWTKKFSIPSARKQLNERVGSLRAGGREFQTPGPATVNVRGPIPNVTMST